jgi:hypothetical protein
MPKYLGPSDRFQLEEGGKVYQRGDNVPISKEMARHMGKVQYGGHRFEGVQAESRQGTSDIKTAAARAEAAEAKA